MRIEPALGRAYRHRRILVTGATGCLGTALVAGLCGLEAAVVGLWHHRQPAPSSVPVSWRKCPTDGPAMAELFAEEQPEVVFHLAASRRGKNPMEQLQGGLVGNLELTRQVLEAARQSRVGALIQTGTVAEYGPVELPFREDRGTLPVTPYGVTKLASTLLTQQYGRHAGLNAASARLFLLYGPGLGEDLFAAQIFRALERGEPLRMSAGEQTRDYIWLDDAVEALLRLALVENLGGQIVNVCSGVEVSLREMVSTLSELSRGAFKVELGAEPYRVGEVMRQVGDPALLERLTGYRPGTSIREGLARMLELPRPRP